MSNEHLAAVTRSAATADTQMDNHERATDTRVITIGGGKGGVGKTMFTALLGLSLVQAKKRTVIIDADFRSPSMNSLLRVKTPQYSLKDFLSRQVADINAILQITQFKNLHLVSGATGVLGMTEYCFSHCSRLIDNLRNINADYILIDLESGTSREAIDLFMTADERIIIANPNPMSIQENYSFLKLCQFKKLRDTFKNTPHMFSLIRESYEGNSAAGLITLGRALREYQQQHPDISLDYFHPRVVLNMMRDQDEALEIRAFQLVCEELLGIRLDFWGSIDYQTDMRPAMRHGDLKQLLTIPTIQHITRKIIENRTNCVEVRRTVFQRQAFDFLNQEGITCSHHCTFWNNCEYQRGGFPCKLKYMGFLCSSAETS